MGLRFPGTHSSRRSLPQPIRRARARALSLCLCLSASASLSLSLSLSPPSPLSLCACVYELPVSCPEQVELMEDPHCEGDAQRCAPHYTLTGASLP